MNIACMNYSWEEIKERVYFEYELWDLSKEWNSLVEQDKIQSILEGVDRDYG